MDPERTSDIAMQYYNEIGMLTSSLWHQHFLKELEKYVIQEMQENEWLSETFFLRKKQIQEKKLWYYSLTLIGLLISN